MPADFATGWSASRSGGLSRSVRVPDTEMTAEVEVARSGFGIEVCGWLRGPNTLRLVTMTWWPSIRLVDIAGRYAIRRIGRHMERDAELRQRLGAHEGDDR